MKYTKEFKIKAVKEKEKGKIANEIFKENNINIEEKRKDYADSLIRGWKYEIKKMGGEEQYLLKKIKNKKIDFDFNKDLSEMSLEEQNIYLKKENELLSEYKRFLA